MTPCMNTESTCKPPENFVIYHLHSDLSNGVTNVDSVTKFQSYVDRAKQCGMKALGFSEHGSLFSWCAKKQAIESAGMKYLHGIEAYLTQTLDEKIRDNYHCVLIARNYDGFLELNELVSSSFNRKDNHFYYVPRISFRELFGTSDNILITTACIGGVFGKGTPQAQSEFLDFLTENKHRSFLEIGHHNVERQRRYNEAVFELSERTGIPLIAGTDTHVLDDVHAKGRDILQKAKGIRFDEEEQWDLRFKTIDELTESYRIQRGALPTQTVFDAIEATNRLADMVEPFEIDTDAKYPHIYDDPERIFEQKISRAIETHPYALKNHSREELEKTVQNELAVYKSTGSVDFMLLQTHLREWERANGIQSGYGRGSVTGSMIAYLLGITQMDSLRFNLNFTRFMNPDRVSLADIDSDYANADRELVKTYLLRDKMGLPNIQSAEIITFNTIALKGAVRDVCRALYKDRPDVDYLTVSGKISKMIEEDEEKARTLFPEVFYYADIINGTVVSVGTHPSGVLVSDLPIAKHIGMCSISSTPYPVSMLNMKELDAQKFVKLDILGLDGISVINDTCRILGIERLTPDNIDLEDMDVWKSIRNDTTLIFQWESNSAHAYLKQFMSDKTLEIARRKIPNFSMLKWLSFGNGLIRPACASFRDNVARGEFYDNGFEELNTFLAPEAGRIAMQETIMRFLVKFCGYTDAQSDTVRRGIAKKKGTEELLPEIERRFTQHCTKVYGLTEEECERIIKPFIQVILDASSYAFSWNHSDAYSAVGYVCGYLRYYHPLEFLTAALNNFDDNHEKTTRISNYAAKTGIVITPPKWGVSADSYHFNKERKMISKGLNSVKFISSGLGDSLLHLSERKKFTRFVDLLAEIDENLPINTRQLDILIKIDYFSDFGNQRELLNVADCYFNTFKRGKAKKIARETVDGTPLEPVIQKYAVGINKTGEFSKSYTLLDVESILRETEDAIKAVGYEDLPTKDKVKNFFEAMGYMGYVTGLEKDRRTLFVTDILPLKRKKDGKQFGYLVFTRSVGSGKEGKFFLRNTLFNIQPLETGDLFRCKAFERDGREFRLTSYEKI